MQTRKLYNSDPYAHTFTAKVVALKPGWVALDQTAFYPEGGGQPADHGWLQDWPVTDTQIDEHGVVWHQVNLAAAIGDTVTGRLDWLRRFDHMQQHTAQHVLSQAFWQLFQATTVGFHLGEQVVTIDLAGGNLAAEQVQQAEDLTNAVLRSKLPVRCQEVAPDALPAAQLRKLPQVDKDIRLIEIAGFDLCPCGGTHVRDLGEIGLLKVVGSENKRGNLRIAFLAGQRAYRDYGNKHSQLATLSASLSEPPENVVPAVERVLARVNQLERECSHLREQVLTLEANDLRAAAKPLGNVACIVSELPDHSLAEAKFLASYLTEQGGTIVIFGLPNEPYRLVAAASANMGIAIGGLLKATVAQHGGKGGGSPTSAQGAVPSSSGQITLTELAQACAKALND
ncbi:MAG TPA: hypothetical protein DDZ53_01775 [Firmicutes bacterium]|nr:hypothetical protein [Bacillota bacterium]